MINKSATRGTGIPSDFTQPILKAYMSNETIYIEKFKEKYSLIDLSEYFDFIKQNSKQSSVEFHTADHHILPQWAFPEFK